MSHILIEKNFENISAKAEKIMSEIEVITDSKGVYMIGIEGVSMQKKALKIKQYQTTILRFIQINHAIDIYKKLESEKKKLCTRCQESLKDGDLACAPDLKQFILCDMLRQSIIVKEAS